jgi:hypothetical protein
MTTIILAVVFVALLFMLPGATIGASLGYWIGGPVGAVILGIVGLFIGDAP